MRVSLAFFPAAIITLLLFLIMQALIGLDDARLALQPSGRAVAILDAAGLLRGERQMPATLPELPVAAAPEALPPLPDAPALATPEAVRSARPFADPPAQVGLPELPLDLGGLKLPPRPAVTPTSTPSPASRPARADRPARTAKAAPPADVGAQQPMGAATAARTGSGQNTKADNSGGAGQGTDTEAKALVRVEPEYPRKAARAGQEGWVKLAFTITPSGGVTDVVVVDAQPRRVFERSARRALEQWRFQPQLVDGRPVPRQATQVIEFKLAGRG